MPTVHRLLRVFVTSLAVVACLAVPAPALSDIQPPRAPADSGASFIDPLYDCEGVGGVGEPVPQHVGVSGVTDNGRTVNLDILVYLDVSEGVEIARETEPQQKAAKMAALESKMRSRIQIGKEAYGPLDINYRLADFRLLAPLDPDGTPRSRTRRASSIINLTRDVLHGKRPAAFDVVYTLTDLDLTEPPFGDDVAGLADCIGGVRYDSRAFAVGELSAENVPVGPLTFYRHGTAKVMAHELGHLLGAHHHYQECVSGNLEGYEDDDYATPCTVMVNAVDLQSLNFSQLEGAVVRGHAIRHAASNDDLVLPEE